MTLLELTIASTMLAVLVASVGLTLRTGRAAWEAHHDDAQRIAAANAAVRHIVRRARQATAVTNISDPSDTSGTLSLLMPSGETYVWDHDGATDELNFGVGAADGLLAEYITSLSFTGYEVDGQTATTVLGDLHSIRCTIGVQLPLESGGDKTVSCRAWLRSW